MKAKGTTMIDISARAQLFVLRLVVATCAAAMLLTDRLDVAQVPDDAWTALALVLGLTLRRPGDVSPGELARALEDSDPTRSQG